MKNVNIEIKIINTSLVLKIRHEVLRKGKPFESASFAGDNDQTTFHVGALADGDVVAVATLVNSSNAHFLEQEQYQLRGMAVSETVQNQGIGNKILCFAEEKLSEKNAELLWCNARKKAVNFYQKNGFLIIDKPFEVDKIGTHYVMYKKL